MEEKLLLTNDKTYSSSKILNDINSSYSPEQKAFIDKIKNKTNLTDEDTQIKKLENLKVLVIGETIIDKYVFCEL